MGVSIAFHLAEAGVTKIVLLESGSLGAGSTSKAAGGVRAQFSDELNIELGRRSLEAFQDFAKRPGYEIELHQVGYLFLLDSEEDREIFEKSVGLQNRHGVPSRMVSVAEAAELSPLIETKDLVGAAYSPTDGHCTPEAVVFGYAAAARRYGARLVTDCPAKGINVNEDDTFTIVTDAGTITTPALVCAAGAWSRGLGEAVGVDLPVTPLRRQVLVTEALAGLRDELPMTIDFRTSFYFHREGPGLLLGMSDPAERPGFFEEVSDDWLERLIPAIVARAPRILDCGIRSSWAGLYEMTPDHNALIGEERPGGRFLYATGFSGHGFLMAPAVGEVIRDLYLEIEPGVDVSALRARRFAAEQMRPELNIV